MPQNKPGPFLLIAVLLIVLFFTLGVRLGQRVEKTNKTINYILSLTPTPKPLSPTPLDPLRFVNYSNKSCGVKFLYPKNLELNKVLILNCSSSNKVLFDLETKNTATIEALFKNKKIIIQKKNKDKLTLFVFMIKNPVNNKNILVQIEENLYPLFENTLQFTSKL